MVGSASSIWFLIECQHDQGVRRMEQLHVDGGGASVLSAREPGRVHLIIDWLVGWLVNY